ncbi:hypothetical protein KP509_23G005400 [Ceratopteris richardii]|uniref:Uncharacterized protein n=1 Tax=Ceratopteris richardii TaxID=49495 RepID=A0A8T2RX65_CERRI|nr:hypothetical protein KP509_23G005300 [Ceratopteris richardii]KAH7300952.1 hypothetical protein KP509_23G005400 [Ceratopteris richardii]
MKPTVEEENKTGEKNVSAAAAELEVGVQEPQCIFCPHEIRGSMPNDTQIITINFGS